MIDLSRYSYRHVRMLARHSPHNAQAAKAELAARHSRIIVAVCLCGCVLTLWVIMGAYLGLLETPH